MDETTKKNLLEWLEEDKVSAAEQEPAVGIFGNEKLAAAFQRLITYVEEGGLDASE